MSISGLALGGIILGSGLFAKFCIINQSYNNRSEFIENYQFPKRVLNEFIAYSNKEGIVLDDKNNVDVVVNSLKQYFQVILAHRHKLFKPPYKANIGMPSKLTDELWHIFLEHMQDYNAFCYRAFGKRLVHIPNENKEKSSHINPENMHKNVLNLMEGCKYVKQNNIHINRSIYAGIPLIFSIDLAFAVPDGYFYTPEVFSSIEQYVAKNTSDTSSGGASGGDISLGDSSGSHGGSDIVGGSGDGSSCGSSGDGGGCGGGCGG